MFSGTVSDELAVTGLRLGEVYSPIVKAVFEVQSTVIHYLKNKMGVVAFVKSTMYSDFIFEVIIFLSKIQNHAKKLSNYGSFSKIWKEKPLP